jgi:hypothetical protein
MRTIHGCEVKFEVASWQKSEYFVKRTRVGYNLKASPCRAHFARGRLRDACRIRNFILVQWQLSC